MRSIGQLIKDNRNNKRLSLDDLEKETKIKKGFIEAIEDEKWDMLPERPVVAGFIKNLAQTLNIDQGQATAMFRRDYPPKSLRINPKPDVAQKFSWSPRLTFLVGVFAVILLVLGYLGFQYYNFITPPELIVDSPTEGQVVEDSELLVSGLTDPQATVEVNNQPVLVDEEGSFKTEVEIFEGTEAVVVKARSRSGKETIVRRSINPELVR